MSDMSENYKKILFQIEQKISNPEEREFVKSKVSELTVMFVEMINRLSDVTEAKINDIEEKQKELKLKMDKVEDIVNGIENDIYLEEGCEFEIICPYCNNEFLAEFDEDNQPKEEIECPECHNIIELDWNGGDYNYDESGACSGHCGGCHGCDEDEFDDVYIENKEVTSENIKAKTNSDDEDEYIYKEVIDELEDDDDM